MLDGILIVLIAGYAGAAVLIADINDTKNMLAGLNLNKTLPVGNSDAGDFFNNQVLSDVNYGVRFRLPFPVHSQSMSY